MILCDIGNSTAKFYNNGISKVMSIEEFQKFEPKDTVYFINVNPNFKRKLKGTLFFDLAPYFEINTLYSNELGVDRIAASCAINDGIVIDAGSAITVDMVNKNIHMGGFILPGITKYVEAYKSISSVLDVGLNSQVNLDKIPLNTRDAITYGVVNSVVLLVENIAKNRKIYITGGDGQFLSQFFKNAVYDKNLVFRSMLNVIKSKGL